jgi:hypothetical protein
MISVEGVIVAAVSQYPEYEIDPGEKVDPIVVILYLSGYAACKRVLLRIQLGPGG